MQRIVVDQGMSDEFRKADNLTEICDPAGIVVGYFWRPCRAAGSPQTVRTIVDGVEASSGGANRTPLGRCHPRSGATRLKHGT